MPSLALCRVPTRRAGQWLLVCPARGERGLTQGEGQGPPKGWWEELHGLNSIPSKFMCVLSRPWDFSAHDSWEPHGQGAGDISCVLVRQQ